MTAAGKIQTARLGAGTIVLYATVPFDDGDRWAPSVRRDRGTYAGRVVAVETVLVKLPGDIRAQRWYDVTLTSAADRRPVSAAALRARYSVTIRCSPAQTWWLASASAKWRAFLGLTPGQVVSS